MGELLSPIELWENFSKELTDDNINIINQTQEDGYICRELYFTAFENEAGKVRAYAKFYFDPAVKNCPSIFFLGSCKRFAETKKFLTVYLKGVSVFTVDYLGIDDCGRYTIYPENLSYANFKYAENNLSGVSSTPKETPWYIWTAIASRALTLLRSMKEVDSEKIAIFGIKTGANLAWKLAAMDGRAKCIVSMFNSGWLGYDFLYKKNRESDIEISEERSLYLASLATQSYAPYVKIPILVNLSTNESGSTFDRGFDTYSRIPNSTLSHLSVIPYADKEIFYEYSDTIVNWLKFHLFGEDFLPPVKPTLRFYNSDGKLYIEIKAGNYEHIKEIMVFQAIETADSSARNWTLQKCENMGDGVYISAAEVLDISEYCFAFANIKYDDNYLLSSNMSAVIPSALGIATTNIKASRLIYDSSFGKDCFTVINNEELFHCQNEISVIKGALDMSGICANIGDLATYKIGDPRFKAYEDDRIQIGYYSPVVQEVKIFVREYVDEKWGNDYFYLLQTSGGDLWNKVSVSANEFKTKDGRILKSFENSVLLYFNCSQAFLINSILWI